MRNTLSLLIVVLAAVFTTSAQANGPTALRCGVDFVKLGDSKFSALQKCGEPVATDSFCSAALVQTTRYSNGAAVLTNGACESVEEWTYNPGYGQFMTTLRFASGRLVSITYGDRAK